MYILFMQMYMSCNGSYGFCALFVCGDIFVWRHVFCCAIYTLHVPGNTERDETETALFIILQLQHVTVGLQVRYTVDTVKTSVPCMQALKPTSFSPSLPHMDACVYIGFCSVPNRFRSTPLAPS